MTKPSLSVLSTVLLATIFFLVTLWYFAPFLQFPAFNLIDDGMSLQVAKKAVTQGQVGGFFEIENGRIRPLYWLYFVGVYLLSEATPWGYWLMQSVMFSLTLLLLWITASQGMGKSRWLSYGLAAPFLTLFFVPSISENLFRLGTAEVRQGALVLAFVVWMRSALSYTKKGVLLGVILLISALLTKETSLLLIPMAVVYFAPLLVSNFKKYRHYLCALLFLSLVGLLFFSLIKALQETAAYSANFQVSLTHIKSNFFISRLQMIELWYLLIFTGGVTVARFILFFLDHSFFSTKKKQTATIFILLFKFWRDNTLIVSLLVGVVASLFFVFSWEYQLERYYYLTWLLAAVYFVWEIRKIGDVVSNQSAMPRSAAVLLVSTGLILGMSFFFFFQKTLPNPVLLVHQNSESKKRWFGDYQNSYSIIRELVRMEGVDHLYTVIGDYEIVYEFGLFANDFDLDLQRTTIHSSIKDLEAKHTLFVYHEDVVAEFQANPGSQKILITNEKNPVTLDPNQFERHVLSSEFLTRYSDRPNWILWRVKP